MHFICSFLQANKLCSAPVLSIMEFSGRTVEIYCGCMLWVMCARLKNSYCYVFRIVNHRGRGFAVMKSFVKAGVPLYFFEALLIAIIRVVVLLEFIYLWNFFYAWIIWVKYPILKNHALLLILYIRFECINCFCIKNRWLCIVLWSHWVSNQSCTAN